MVKGQKKGRSFLLVLSVVLFSCFSMFSSAVLVRNNVTIPALNVDSTALLNLTANGTLSATTGHFYFTNLSNITLQIGPGNITTPGILLPANNTSLLVFGYWYKGFFSLPRVPNGTFRQFTGSTYGYSPYSPRGLSVGDTIGFMINDSLDVTLYGVAYVTEINTGLNISLEIMVNTVDNNNSMSGAQDSCTNYGLFNECIGDYTNSCNWNDGFGLCESFAQHSTAGNLPPAECGMLPKSACDGINSNVCTWDVNSGTHGRCVQGSLCDIVTGFQCANITNVTFCANQSYTMQTGLCSWNGTDCLKNTSKTVSNIEDPPVFSCKAVGYYDNQSACEVLENVYYLPCGWNNVTSKCEELFMDFGKFDAFEEIGSENTCGVMGGTWQSETTYDPASDQFTTEEWCEFGAAIKAFESVGSGSISFGNTGQFNDCNQDCFACEFLTNGSRVENLSVAQTRCQNSNASCTFTADGNAMNGFGWCDSASGFKSVDCNKNCGDCAFQPSPQTACINSFAGCKWDNFTSACISGAAKSCNQDCMQCDSETSCNISTANTGCTWNTLSFYCTPQGGSYEICYDGTDNDNNNKTDCFDSKCSFDPFCGGSYGDAKNCYKYDEVTYKDGAQGNCTAVAGCTWNVDAFGFSFCSPAGESCHMNVSLTTRAVCDAHLGGSVCKFETENACTNNETMMRQCFSKNQVDCGTTRGCLWHSEYNFCEFAPYATCEKNSSLQSDQTLCEAAGCYWNGNDLGQYFEGFYSSRCVSPCGNISIAGESACTNANGTKFVPGTCEWKTGLCEAANFIGGCFDNDGDVTACQANSNCVWNRQDYASLKSLNGSASFNDKHFTNETWIAVGLQFPTGTSGVNSSNYSLKQNISGNPIVDNELRLYVASGLALGVANVTRLFCNADVIMEYNWSSGSCVTGKCEVYNRTTCGGKNVHYYFRNSTKTLEVLWEVELTELILDSDENDTNVTATTNTSTVVINGNLTEHVLENASANDGSNASRVLTSSGFCNDKGMYTYFGGMDHAPPLQIAIDSTGGANEPPHAYLDISGLGLKKTEEAYAYTIFASNMGNSSYCNGVSISSGVNGNGRNTSKYYLYLDTDGSSSAGCPALDAGISGFEYLFKYVVESASDGKLVETKIVQNCQNNVWVASSVGFSSDRAKGCGFFNGPILAIAKEVLNAKSDVNATLAWRAYVTSANSTGNVTYVMDSAGPGTGDFNGIDVSVVDCTDPEFKDNSQCSKFKQFGFFPGEFGPACKDNVDNDGDKSIDCSDTDCSYDPFFCGGSFAVNANDKSAPSLVWTKTNTKVPTSLSFIFDTNEPSNGSVEFYGTDSTCSALNSVLLDSSATDNLVLTNYRPHHVTDKAGLTANTTYYFKYRSCDPSANCMISKCSNSTTAIKHTNVTFKLAIPLNWTMDIPALNLTTYSGQYAVKASTQHLSNMNITVNSQDNTTGITFVGVDVFEKRTFNISDFINASNIVGMDANQYQAFKQKTGVEKVIIRVPTDGTASTVEHCDDTGTACKDVSNTLNSLCTFFTGYMICEVPDAVGLGFSGYQGKKSGGGGGGGGGSRAGSGGGSGSPSTALPSNPPAYATRPASESKPLSEGGDVSDISTAAEAASEAAKEEAGTFAGKAAAAALAKEGKPWELKAKWATIFGILGLVAVVGYFIYAKYQQHVETSRRR